MGVHDQADSKYSLMGAGNNSISNFAKLTAKRPSSEVFCHGSNNSKHAKIEESVQKKQQVQIPEVILEKTSLQQQRKALPVYRLRKK